MRRQRCPDPELIARSFEQRLDRRNRVRILAHAADCAPCRRHLAVSSLSPWGLRRAFLMRQLSPERLAIAVGVVILPLLLYVTGDTAEDAGVVPRRATSRIRPVRALPTRSDPSLDAGDPLPANQSEEGVTPLVPPAPPENSGRDPIVRDPFLVPARLDPVPSDPEAPSPAPRDHSVVELPRSETRSPKAPPVSEALGRVAIFDPFGGLALEGVGGGQSLQTTHAVPSDGRLLAVGRTSGFRLGDGLRVQLVAGSAVSVFQSSARQCPGLAVHQGMLLVDSPQRRSLVLGRGRSMGVLEGLTGLLHVSAGALPGAMSVTPLGAGAVWRREGEPDVELGPGDLLSFDPGGQELARQGTRPRPSLARFISWPEATTLFFATFESDVYGGERPQVLQGSVKEGYLSAVAGAPRKKVIELTLPPGVQVPADAVVRLRFRTTASRIQCVGGRSQSLSLSVKARSETTWTSMILPLKNGEPDGFQGGAGKARRNGRGNLLITVEGPARASDDMIFDVDQVEILRS